MKNTLYIFLFLSITANLFAQISDTLYAMKHPPKAFSIDKYGMIVLEDIEAIRYRESKSACRSFSVGREEKNVKMLLIRIEIPEAKPNELTALLEQMNTTYGIINPAFGGASNRYIFITNIKKL